MFNRDGLEPQVSGGTYTWELRELPWMEREEYSPPLALRVPRLTVSYFPPTDNQAGLKGLRDWASVSAWVSQFMDPQAEVTDAIRAKAAQLTAGVTDETAKIRAIAAFVQQTNYVEISLNLTRGGGYTPHRADETLAKNYGDCKDKSTLMRALLKAAGIDSYVTVISASDRNYVRPEWASPMQFNHAIVAVRVSSAVALPTVIEDAKLGQLLMFDPTDRVTPSAICLKSSKAAELWSWRVPREPAEDAAASAERQPDRFFDRGHHGCGRATEGARAEADISDNPACRCVAWKSCAAAKR